VWYAAHTFKETIQPEWFAPEVNFDIEGATRAARDVFSQGMKEGMATAEEMLSRSAIVSVEVGRAKVARARKTPHENPELLLKGKNRVTKKEVGHILGLSERAIRSRIEDGRLQLVGTGHRKMVTVASVKAQINPA
jgi:hypothetical protein